MRRTPIYLGKLKGMTLIEIMVALAIGSVLLIGLATVFFNSSRTHRELEKSGQMIENGRYAMNLVYDDLRHAGFYGYFFDLPAAPAALPDPCETVSLANLTAAMSLPIQGYNNPTAASIDAATTCGSSGKQLLTSANLQSGSDILVLRRADTGILTGVAVKNDVYLQANGQTFEFTFGATGSNVPTTKADGTAATMLKFPSSPIPYIDPNTGAPMMADTRKYHVHVYFVAPCSTGTGANGVCQAGDTQLPTLKRLELSSNGATTQMSITPLVEGIQYFKVEYGIDDTPATTDPTTFSVGDGIPDSYVAAPALAQWPNVVSVRIHVLARNVKSTDDYKDTASYTLAGGSFGPFNDKYKRHVFSTEVRPMNVAGRREIP